jgi:glycosidase
VSTNGSWVATPAGNWIHLDKSSGSGNASITVTVDEQDDQANRSANILFVASLSSQEKQASVMVNQSGNSKPPVVEIVPQPAAFDGNKRASTTYQLLIYSFADSNGDGIGDFKGIENRLDYLDGLGATALWLSPAHPTNSYHGYDVNDYFGLNPKFGTEEDFKSLIDAADAKGIKIYMDYVLNHSGTGTEWFKSVKADPANSPYRDYYVLSTGDYPSQAVGRMGGWITLGDGKIGYKGRLHFKVDWTGNTKYVTVTETTESAQSPNTTNAKRWIHVGSKGSLGMYETSTNIFEITLDVDTDWGFLVRTSNDDSWPSGTKYGGKTGKEVITLGQPFALDNTEATNIVFGQSTSYYASFDASMPDLNYGKPDECETSRAFQSTVASAKKWVEMGVDGFRLDAVVWIYAGSWEANVKFLDKWYKAVNAEYKAVGHSGDIFMVGEAWDGNHSNPEKYYYRGLPSNFEFDYGYALRDMLKSGSASGFASKVAGFVTDHTAQRSDAITSFFLSNHDQNRFASEIGKSVPKEKQAAAILLSGPGKPFVYQGEELGYWGVKDNGDEYVRTPILWDKAGKECAKKGVNSKVDGSMLKADISVEAQQADAGSVWTVYKTWSQLRNTYPALAGGEMSMTDISGSSIASWYMTSGSQKLLVVHNFSTSEKKTTVSDSMQKPIALLGTASYQEKELTLGPNSSVVFEL